MIEQDIFNNVNTILRDMVDADEGVYNLDWSLLETLDTLQSPTGIGPNQRTTADNTPALFLSYDEKADQYIGQGLGGGDIGFGDIPSIGTLREMTPLILRVVLLDDDNGDNGTLSGQIAKARDDIRRAIGDKLRTDDTHKIDGVYRVYVGPYDLSSDISLYTNTAEFVIPIIVWWRHDYRNPTQSATIIEDSDSPLLPLLEITPDFTAQTIEVTYQLPTDTATLAIYEVGDATPRATGLQHIGSTQGTWTDTRQWDIDKSYRFEVTDGSHTSETPEIKYPYYPTMLPESLYDLGDSPEQNIERKIRQLLQKEIDTDSRFDGIKRVVSGPLSPNYLKPDLLPIICITFDESALNASSRSVLRGISISNPNVGWRTANARDQVLQFMAMVHAPADREYTDPYKQIRIIDKTLSELRSFVIANEQWEGVNSVYQSIIGPMISPRAAENVQGDLLFVGRFNFIVRYRES